MFSGTSLLFFFILQTRALYKMRAVPKLYKYTAWAEEFLSLFSPPLDLDFETTTLHTV